ncbi:MAG: glycoside hydrolase family 66 protein [Pirellulales bacterium]
MKHWLLNALAIAIAMPTGHVTGVEIPPALRVGRAGHAFDHLGGFGDQAETAAASGATIIYASGLGGLVYEGVPSGEAFGRHSRAVAEYNRLAKQAGIEIALGYMCATSIVGLDTFDANWSEMLRDNFKSPVAEWLQQDRQGQPLPSWYGGEYRPACMNHPDWRRYHQLMVEQQLLTGHDGIFFDNPTVHPKGCYCAHCMEKFATFLHENGTKLDIEETDRDLRVEALRKLADEHPQEFMRFRCTIARDFLAHIRDFARTINPHALITCNNSLNVPDVLYRQARMYAYNIAELSKAGDLVVVEDMVTQPRVTADGKVFEYGPTYKQLHAISHGKPIVAVALAEADYHTPPNLVRLAMAEAAANEASYLSWPAWPEAQRERMVAAIRPQADFLRQHEALLNDAAGRADVVLFLPFRRWVETEVCTASNLATALSQANVQYEVFSEEDFKLSPRGGRIPVLLVESLSVLTPAEAAEVEAFRQQGGRVITADAPDWLEQVRAAVARPSLTVAGPSTVRAVMRDQPKRTILHLLNLNVERLSSFEDKVTPATDIKLTVRVPLKSVREVKLLTADENETTGTLEFDRQQDGDGSLVTLTVPRLDVSAMVVIEE